MSKKKFLITGATGILGSWVLAECLRRGHEAVAMLRDESLESARRRLDVALAVARHDTGNSSAELLLGDNTLPNFGIERDRWETLLPTLDGVVHCAALTSFSRKKDALIWDTNVGGVQSLLHLLEGSGVPLYHVSTAYVAASPDGFNAPEGPPKPEGQCRNQYERSKRAAELLVLEASSTGKLRASIFRPSIIVGATGDGRIHQFMNFYQLLRLVDLIESGVLPISERVRVQAHRDATLNLVPCDWVAEALWDVIESASLSGRVYHLTNPSPLPLVSIANWARARVQRTGADIEFVESLEGETLSEMEQYIRTMSTIFLEYVSRPEPLFGRANVEAALASGGTFPDLDEEFLNRLLDYARESQWESAFGRSLSNLQRP